MVTVILTDGKYRSAIAMARELGRAGYAVTVTQTRADARAEPPVFASKYATGRWLEGSVADPEYPDRLMALLAEYENPVLLCVGAGSLAALSQRREELARVAGCLLAPPAVLDALNDKAQVHARAKALGIPVPEEYSGTPDRYPVVIKPHCGEKLQLKAADRYVIARSPEEFARLHAAMAAYDPEPLVQAYVDGPGRGASVLLGPEGELLAWVCHRRIREYPMSGGPSTCCRTFDDPDLVEHSCRLLRSFGFVGLAMVEYKGDCLLEVNPRVWGSFPLSVAAGSGFCTAYVRSALGLPVTPLSPKAGVTGRFLVNDLAASLDLLRHGRLGPGFAGLLDLFRVPELLKDPLDPAPYRRYVRSYFRGR